MVRIFAPLAFVIGIVALFATPDRAEAQEATCDTAFKDWSVCAPTDPKECFVVSPPVSSEARRGGNVVTVRRGNIRLFVTIRPTQGVNKEISFTGGYPFRKDSTVEVEIAGAKYTMNTGSGDSAEWAWPASPERDAALIEAMKSGASAKVTAVSSRGTQTIDNFSLLGFTAALEEAEKLCQ